MMQWIYNNLSTMIVSLILIVIVILIIKDQIQSKRNCHSGCCGCPMAGKCHNEKK
ncbi:MAG: FeoB-associated Cys-rich membrane protein [Longibaculum sp.]